MIKKISTAKLSESQWQELRKTFTISGMVGGSDASTLLGLNPYKSPINMYYQAIGINSLPNRMNGAMLHGKQLESYVANCWQYWDGTEEGWVQNTLDNNKIKRYTKIKSILVNDKYPMLFANVDGKITKHPERKTAGVLEIKTISGYSSDMYEAGIPPGYLVQLQHYLLVTGLKWGEIAYLKDGRQLGCITFDAYPDLQNRIIESATEFYERVKEARKELEKYEGADDNELLQVASAYEPDADNSIAFDQFISDKHKQREDEVAMVGTDLESEWAIKYTQYNEEIKSISAEKQLYQNRLKQTMEKQGATIMHLPNGKITWRKQFNVKLND